ncbi:MAG TPA: hypothetical protein VFW50_10770 [Streptosporangiaceae bacterium]|nr:hypothetical protein [Streptosporangiaceae bacterium]
MPAFALARGVFAISAVTAALLAIGAMTITVIQLAHLAGRYTGAGAGLSIVIAAWRLRRTRG